MSKVVARLLPPVLAIALLSVGAVRAQQPDRPPNLNLGDAVVSGFSGTLAPDPSKPHPPQKSAVDLTFINPDGASARIIGLGQPGYVWDGRLLQAPKTFDVFARDVGQVFGVALDDQTPPNIYLAATSLFGLNIVGRGRDGQPERRKKGGPGAGWMKGQFGLELQGGPGAIYKVDGRTGVVSLFANVTLDGVPNPGPGLGNLAYDAAHKQLFVSDLYTGMIHRFALDGRDLGPPYDHGVSGPPAQGNVPAQAFNPRIRLNIANARFDSEDPDTWGFAPPARQVWALAVHEGRLYYSAGNGAPKNGPQIWSVGIERDGSFASDPRWELDVAAEPGPFAVSDIAFSQKGAMILAQRAPIAGAYDYVAFTPAGEPRVLRYRLKDPNDPPSPGRWKEAPDEYAIGLAGDYRNTNGGVALGYGYGADGAINAGSCEAALWTTGQNLRNNPAQRSQLESGGPLAVNGLQGSPADLVRNENAPPTLSYFIDYDGKFDDARASGHMGSVRILTKPCTGAVAVSSPAAVAAGGGGGGGGGGGACVCKQPFLPGPVAGQCVCPKGTVIQGDECVPEICPPPTTPGPVPGMCICHYKGGPCSCPLPLIAGPSPGECVWPLQTKQCVGITGSIIVKKEVTTRNTLIPWPNPGPLFPMTLTCIAPPQSWSFSLNNNGTYTANNIPFGKTCTVTEGAMPAWPPNLCPKGLVPVWTPPPFTTPASVLINGTTVTMIVHNTVTCEKPGELSVTKKVSPDPRGIGNTLPFPMTVTCTNPPAPPFSYPLTIPGNTSSVPHSVPVGYNCTVAETLPALPKGCTWLPPIFSPPTGVIIQSGLNQETVTNGYTCSDGPVCPPPQVMNIDGICECPPPMVTGAVPGTCVCPQGTQLVDGKCVPVDVCQPPQIMIPGVGFRCPDDEVLVNGKCVHRIVCKSPLVPNASNTGCRCPDHEVLRRGKCVKVEEPKHHTCKRGYHWNGDMCVKNKTEPREDLRELPGLRLPGGSFPRGGGRGDHGGASPGGGQGPTPDKR